MFPHKVESTYGRLVAKPEKKIDIDDLDVEEDEDENIPIQDQIENLRIKIALRERYNRVLKEEFEESQLGTSNIVQDLFDETKELREQLIDALQSEQFAVQNALRTQRAFQMAMSERSPHVALPWLDDKLWDAKSKLNFLMDELSQKRKKLEEAEQMVLVLEKWPVPGSLPWEVKIYKDFRHLEYLSELFRTRKEAAEILLSKYMEIRFILEQEKDKYAPTLRQLENQLSMLKKEHSSLLTMKAEALVFHADATKEVQMVEKEASENRKQRRKQMAKIKKEVDKVLAENEARNNNNAQDASANANRPINFASKLLDFQDTDDEEGLSLEDKIQLRAKEVEIYQNEARKLVETMRVPNLTYIPERLRTVKTLGQRIKSQLQSKQELRDQLLKQRNYLLLIQAHFRFAGQKQDAEYNDHEKEYKAAISTLDVDLAEAKRRLSILGDISVNLRLSIISIAEKLENQGGKIDEEVKRREFIKEPSLKTQMEVINSKITKLVETVDGYEQLFDGHPPERNYAQFIKPIEVPDRLIRVGSPHASEESEEEDMPDSKVPTNEDIKFKSLKIIQQTILKRGLS